MTPNDYQRQALRTEHTPKFIAFSSDNALDRLVHGALGAATEAGELQDQIKRHLIYGKELDAVNVLEEAGDLLWYIALVLDSQGQTLEEAMARNLAKLQRRFPDKFTAEAALHRDLESEREALEGSLEGIVLENLLEQRHRIYAPLLELRAKIQKAVKPIDAGIFRALILKMERDPFIRSVKWSDDEEGSLCTEINEYSWCDSGASASENDQGLEWSGQIQDVAAIIAGHLHEAHANANREWVFCRNAEGKLEMKPCRS